MGVTAAVGACRAFASCWLDDHVEVIKATEDSRHDEVDRNRGTWVASPGVQRCLRCDTSSDAGDQLAPHLEANSELEQQFILQLSTRGHGRVRPRAVGRGATAHATCGVASSAGAGGAGRTRLGDAALGLAAAAAACEEALPFVADLFVEAVSDEDEKALQGRDERHEHEHNDVDNLHALQNSKKEGKELQMRRKKGKESQQELKADLLASPPMQLERTQDNPTVTKMLMITRNSLEFSRCSASGALERVP